MVTFTTKKTLVLKKPDAEAPVDETTPAGVEMEGDNPPVASVFGAAPLPGVQAEPVSYTWAAICALIAVVLLLALLGLQWMEGDYYRSAIPTMTAGLGR